MGRWLLVLVAACGKSAATPDAAFDAAPPDAGAVCLASGAWQVCIAPPAGPLTLPTSINTSPGSTDCATLTNWGAGQPEACIVAGTTITVSSDTLAFGTRPLVLAATDTVMISALLDVGSHQMPARSTGAGANAGCAAFARDPGNNNNVGGGGAGGTLTSKGGDGGDSSGSVGGQASGPADPPTVLHGGCAGQRGGNGTGGGNGMAGAPGDGGGALFVVAGNHIVLATTAVIAASGSGGAAGGFDSGGSGGGTGGMIALAAPAIDATAMTKLVANGGAGSSGGTGSQNGSGAPDLDPGSPTTQQGLTQGAGGSGGPGFAGTHPPVAGVDSGEGAGGGGGGAGYIQANHVITGNPVTSPTVMLE